MDDSVRRGIAYHEGGHVVTGTALGLTVLGTDILSDGEGGRGHTRFAPPWPGFNRRPRRFTAAERQVLEKFCVTFMAGFAAEARLGNPSSAGSGYDERDVVETWITLLADDAPTREVLASRYLARATAILAEPANWHAVVTVAERLLAAPALDGTEVRLLIASPR